MKWLLLTIFLSGCTVVLWSDNIEINTDVKSDDIGIKPVERLK